MEASERATAERMAVHAPGHDDISRSRARQRWIAVASFTSLAIVASCLVGLLVYSNGGVGISTAISQTAPSPSPSPSPASPSFGASSIRLRGGGDVHTTTTSSHPDRRRGTDDDKDEKDDRGSGASQMAGTGHPRQDVIRRREMAPAGEGAGNDESGGGGEVGGTDGDDYSRLHSHPGNHDEGGARGGVRGNHHHHHHRRRRRADDRTSSNATETATDGGNGGADREGGEGTVFDEYNLAPPAPIGGDNGGPANQSSRRSNQTPPTLVQEARIIGGNAIDDEDRHPYLVAVFRELPGDRLQHVCGGTLVAPNVVLSAAHCHSKFRASVIRTGATDLRSSDEDNSMEEFDIVESLVHPDYDGVRNDLVLFVLDGTSRYAPINLNEGSSRPRVGRNLYVMGWGRTTTPSGGKKGGKGGGSGSSSSSSPVAREVVVKAMSNDDCDDAYGHKLRVTGDMLCAANPGRDACDGDSGGPAIIRGDNPGEDLLVGVISVGIGCADPKYPGVYARVSAAVGWIGGWLDAIEADGEGDDDGGDSYHDDGDGGNGPREVDGDEDGEDTDPSEVKKNENDNAQGRRSEAEKTGTAGDCADVEGSFQVSTRGKKRDCAWVGKERGKRCDDDDLSQKCPMTCGRCGDRR